MLGIAVIFDFFQFFFGLFPLVGLVMTIPVVIFAWFTFFAWFRHRDASVFSGKVSWKLATMSIPAAIDFLLAIFPIISSLWPSTVISVYLTQWVTKREDREYNEKNKL